MVSPSSRPGPLSMALAMGSTVRRAQGRRGESTTGRPAPACAAAGGCPAPTPSLRGLSRPGRRELLERASTRSGGAAARCPRLLRQLEVRPILAREESAWAHAFALAFLGRPPASPAAAAALRGMIRAEGNVCFAALEREEVVAVAIASVHGGVATLSGAGVVPHHRGRGLQGALVRALWAAAERGCDLAASVTDPGTASQRTLERAGFRLRIRAAGDGAIANRGGAATDRRLSQLHLEPERRADSRRSSAGWTFERAPEWWSPSAPGSPRARSRASRRRGGRAAPSAPARARR